MLKGQQYRIYPTKEQEELFAKHFGCARYVYNWVLSQRKDHYEKTKKTLPKKELQNKLVHEEKKDKPWLEEVNSQSLLASMFHALDAYKRFFSGKAEFPRFKSKKNHEQKYQCPQHVKVYFDNDCVYIPKVGFVKAKLHRKIDGQVKTCTITKKPDGTYLISVLFDTHEYLPQTAPIEEVSTMGVDVGIKHFATLSTGEKRENPRFLDKSLPKVRQLNKQLSRKKKGSKNREKCRHKLAIKHDDVVKQREFFLHREANRLLGDNQTVTVALEDLNIQGMIKNRRLSRHIADVAWGEYDRILNYKAKWQGKNIIYCPRFAPSSKQCVCGYKNANLTLSDRVWICPECNRVHDRDLLGANNVKYFALVEAVGLTACVKPFPHNNTCQRKCYDERSSYVN